MKNEVGFMKELADRLELKGILDRLNKVNREMDKTHIKIRNSLERLQRAGEE